MPAATAAVGRGESTSNCTELPGKGLYIKFMDETQKIMFVHMLIGTAFAISPASSPLLENFQQRDGTVKLPRPCAVLWI
jgi:seryl-tRNA synthetase